MNRQLEAITQLEVLGYHVRVWTTIDKLEDQRHVEDYLSVTAAAFVVDNMRYCSGAQIAEFFAKLENTAAVEVKNRLGNGVIIYPDWK